MEYYHNPRCKKSREGLTYLKEKGIEPKIREYLKNPPSIDELKLVIQKLDIPAKDLIRKQEKVFKEVYKGKELNEEGWIEAMVQNPKLIERPILITSDKAAIGRPAENFTQIL